MINIYVRFKPNPRALLKVSVHGIVQPICLFQKLTYLRKFIWYTSDGRPPRDIPLCGFFGELCFYSHPHPAGAQLLSIDHSGTVFWSWLYDQHQYSSYNKFYIIGDIKNLTRIAQFGKQSSEDYVRTRVKPNIMCNKCRLRIMYHFAISMPQIHLLYLCW